ncbi:MAG: insulinase family protein, partial [Inquilinus sp.]|nr:insulinase family protein [Inquilinus sp.]
PVEPSGAAERLVVVRHPDVQQPSWQRYYLAPSYRTLTDGEPYALQVLSEILGGGSTGRLYRALVVERRVAVSAGTGYSGNDYDETRFVVYGAPADGTDPEALGAAIEAEIDRLLAEGITDKELADAKRGLVTAAVYARDSVGGPARALGSALTAGRTIAGVEAWPDRIAAVTAEDVLHAARLVLRPDRSVTGYLLPAERAAELTQ